MATIFAESFDCYNTVSDMSLGQWNATAGTIVNASPAFGVGRYMSLTSSASTATFSSASNEATVYGSIRVLQPSGTGAQYSALTFTDGGTAQCTIRFNSDGSIGLYSGGPAGTLLQTYPGMSTPGSWHGYQFKVVINNTTGSIEIRMDGSTTNAITKTGVNTRLGTANAFVNGVSFISSGILGLIDDLFLNNVSGNAPTSWPGDLRAFQQNPTVATQTNFSVFPVTSTIVGGGTQISSLSCTNGNSYYGSFSTSVSGKISSIVVVMNASATANMKFALFDSTGPSGPGASLGTSNVLVNPVSGNNTVTWSSPISIAKGATYWIGWSQDATAVIKNSNNASPFLTGIRSSTTAYASFPATNPTLVSIGVTNDPSITVNITSDNAAGIQELTQDGDTSYVYTSTVTEDKYAMSPIPTSYSVVAMQYYAMYKRSDVGARTMQLSVAANGSADTALITDAAIPNSYAYKFKTNELDPTGAAWTPNHVNGAIVGLAVTV